MPIIEIELRYLLSDKVAFLRCLEHLGAYRVREERLTDHWYIPVSISSRQEHDRWFNEERNCSVRIRETYDGDRIIRTALGTKRLTPRASHQEILEAEVVIHDYAHGHGVLTMMDYKEFLTIYKERVLFACKDFEIALDSIQHFGAGVEIEHVGQGSYDKKIKEIRDFASELGLQEVDLYPKSLTVSAMDTLARFDV